MLCNNLLEILGTAPIQDPNLIPEKLQKNKSSKLIVQKKPDNLIKKIKKTNKINLEANLNLINRWKSQNFMEFNHWLQVSKADFGVEYQSIQDNRSFLCNAFVKLPSISKDFSNSGIGMTKKLSKINAIENILIEIAKKDCLKYGLKSNSIINEIDLKESDIKRKKSKKKSKQNSTIKSMVENINNLLNEDKFISACKIFCQILILKQVTWEEISGIWLYCIFKQKIEYLKSLLDLIAIFNKKHCSIKETSNSNWYSNDDQLINEELKQKYGFYRINNDNLFDNYDPFNYYAGKKELIYDEQEQPKNYSEINTEFKLFTESDNNLIQKEYDLKDVIPISSLSNNNLDKKEEIQGIKVPLSLKLSNFLLDSLLYNLNFNFALSISELLYSRFAISENFFHKNSSNYFLHKKNLLIIDLIEKISRRMKKELIEYNLKLELIDDKINYEVLFKFEQNNLVFDAICEDDLVYISFGELKEERQGFIGIIYKKDNSNSNQILIKSFLSRAFIINTKNHSNFFLKKLVSKKKYDMLGDDLTNFIRNNCCSQEISDVILQNYSDKSLLNILRNSINEENQQIFIPKFNNTQNEALNKALIQKLTLIEGPSTSGKTTLASEIINQWIKNNKSQILACSSDKDSTDLLHCMLLNCGLKSYRYNGYSKEMKLAISDFDIICSHIINSNDDYLNQINFSRILIDNSNQITEIDVISKLTKKCQQLVLIGDSKQFSYAIKSDLLRSKGMQISLFERLIKQNHSSILLNVQYKIPLSIFLYSTYSFYNKLIQNSNYNSDFTKCLDSFKWPNISVNFSFLHVKGNEKNYKNSMINKNEIYIIKELLGDIIKQKENEKIKISVVTYYKAQRNELKKLISTLLTENEIITNTFIEMRKEIGTYLIDDFLNKESDLIICSMVRSNSKGILGYLKDYRKLNSLISRTRKGLIIVGDLETLSFDRVLNNFLFWAKVNNLIMKK